MLPFLAERFGNPSGAHARGPRRPAGRRRGPRRRGRGPRVRARARSCSPAAAPRPTTSPSSGVRRAVHGGVAVCSAIEHHAVLHPRRAPRGAGRRRRRRRRGRPRRAWPTRSTTRVRVVSVMLANNEVGTIQPLADVADLVRERAPGAVLHTDAVQALPWLDVPRRGRRLRPGRGLGPQVRRAQGRRRARRARRRRPRAAAHGRRPGARPAQRHAQRRRHRGHGRGHAGHGRRARARRWRASAALRDRLARRPAVAEVRRPASRPSPARPQGRRHLPRAASRASRARRCCSCSTRTGVCASAASSCAAGRWSRRTCSAAMGVPEELAPGSLRLSLGSPTTDADVDRALDVVPAAVARLRRRCRAGVAVERARRHVRRRRLVGRGRAAARRGPRRRRRHAEAVGRRVRHRLLLGRRRRRRPPGRRSSSASTTSCSTSATTSTAHVVEPYVAAHAAGRTPNPCVECNRHLKFDRLPSGPSSLGFDAVGTGHHARIVPPPGRAAVAPRPRAPTGPRTSPTCCTCSARRQLAGDAAPGRRPDQGRGAAAGRRARPAHRGQARQPGRVLHHLARRPRAASSATRIPLHAAAVVDTAGRRLGRVDAVELVTVGQRRGSGCRAAGRPRYVVGRRRAPRTVVTVGLGRRAPGRRRQRVERVTWVDGAVAGDVLVQCSAHGEPRPATVDRTAAGDGRRALARAPAPGGAGPERRALRPPRHVRARRRRRRLCRRTSRGRVLSAVTLTALGLGHGAVQERGTAEEGARADRVESPRPRPLRPHDLGSRRVTSTAAPSEPLVRSSALVVPAPV